MINQSLIEHFPALDATGACGSAFIKRIPGIDAGPDKAEALRRLDSSHRELRGSLGIAGWPLMSAEQVHGNQVAVVQEPVIDSRHFAGCDGFVTNQRRVTLAVYVADCCAVFLADPVRKAVGLVHSGKKGTELEIAGRAIAEMESHFGTKASDLVVELSPCIRPPHYEVDFAAQIAAQCRERGVALIHDRGTCTACDLESYYSYRLEKGRTGRMLALLWLV